MPASEVRYGVQPSGCTEPEPNWRGWDRTLPAVWLLYRLKPELHACFGSLRRFLVAALRGLEVKRADAAAACDVPGDIQGSAEIDRFRAVENFLQRVPARISN